MAQKSKIQTEKGETGPPNKKVSVLEDLRAKQDVVTKNPQTRPVARLDFLSSTGKVLESKEYHSETDFLKALQEELFYGVPLIVVLYRDENGKTIPKRFLEDLDMLPKGLLEEDIPGVQKRKSPVKKEGVR